jgi:carbon storage regulator
MLVLTRRIGESIIIGNGIKLTIVSVGPGRVKLGIDAPPSVRIDREEIHARILQEKASDVLEAVSSGNVGAALPDSATAIVASSDTGVLHGGEESGSNSPTASAGASASPTPAPVNRLSQYRTPRKPR